MRSGSTPCLLLTLLVACGGGPPAKPPARAHKPEHKSKPVVLEVEAVRLTLAGLRGEIYVESHEQAGGT